VVFFPIERSTFYFSFFCIFPSPKKKKLLEVQTQKSQARNEGIQHTPSTTTTKKQHAFERYLYPWPPFLLALQEQKNQNHPQITRNESIPFCCCCLREKRELGAIEGDGFCGMKMIILTFPSVERFSLRVLLLEAVCIAHATHTAPSQEKLSIFCYGSRLQFMTNSFLSSPPRRLFPVIRPVFSKAKVSQTTRQNATRLYFF
jgi:hypothetical protein